jgi:hypothetical protein
MRLSYEVLFLFSYDQYFINIYKLNIYKVKCYLQLPVLTLQKEQIKKKKKEPPYILIFIRTVPT